MIDEAFLPLARMLEELLAFPGEVADEWQRTRITGCALDLPIELCVRRGEDGGLELGAIPPLYLVDTTLRPSYHQVRLTAASEVADGG